MMMYSSMKSIGLILKIINQKSPQATGDDFDDQTKTNLSNDDETDANQFNKVNTFKSMLAIMQSDETVLRTIKRLETATSM
jgi:hypothetical protein